jgi:molecular chaperone DnaJ
MKSDVEGGKTGHENEGFLKSAWHNITGQHKQEHRDEDEKKKGSGSG